VHHWGSSGIGGVDNGSSRPPHDPPLISVGRTRLVWSWLGPILVNGVL